MSSPGAVSHAAVSPDFEPEPAAPSARPAWLEDGRVRAGLGLIVVIVAGFALFGVADWWTRGRFIETTNDAFLQADQVTVAPRLAGYVDQVLVSDNQEVVAGQPLVKIDGRDAQARLEQARAQADQARAGIAQAQAQIQQQLAVVQQSQAQLGGARSGAAYAALQVDRYGPLARSGAEAGEHLDQLTQNRDQAQAQAAAAAAQVLAAQRQIQTLQAQIQVATAQLEQAQAQVRQASVDADAALVRASIAGRIGDRTVRAGQYVQPGVRLMSVVPVQALYLNANFKETQLARMRPGQPVLIKVDALGDKTLKGVVDSFAPGTGSQFALIAPNNATGNFTKIVQRVPVRIRLQADADAPAVLVPGLSVEVSVDTRARAAASGGAVR